MKKEGNHVKTFIPKFQVKTFKSNSLKRCEALISLKVETNCTNVNKFEAMIWRLTVQDINVFAIKLIYKLEEINYFHELCLITRNN